jgi:membrane protein required for colicin V production
LSDYTLDIILAIPLLVGAFFGFKRGLIMELSRIVSLIVGVYVAVRFSYLFTDYIYDNTDIDTEFLPIISFCLVMLGMMVLIHLLAKLIDKTLKTVALGWALRITGGIFGFLRMAFIVSLILMLGHRSEILKEMEKGESFQKSVLYEPLVGFSQLILPVLESIDKDSWKNRIERKTKEIQGKLEDLIDV